jgi:hypothetical protein
MSQSAEGLTPPPEGTPPAFADLTLGQVLQLLTYQPVPTLRRLFAEIALPAEGQALPSPKGDEVLAVTLVSRKTGEFQAVGLPEIEAPTLESEPPPLSMRQGDLAPRVWAGGLLVALVLALIGGLRLYYNAPALADNGQPSVADAPLWFGLAILLYLSLLLADSRTWWAKQLRRPRLGESTPPSARPPVADEEKSAPFSPFALLERHAIRFALMPLAAIFAYLSYTQNVVYTPDGARIVDVAFTLNGTLAWFLAIALWTAILAFDFNGLWVSLMQGGLKRGTALSRRAPMSAPPYVTYVLLALIVALGVYWRFNDLEGVPPDMTSDHIEKLLDAKRVAEGYEAIFFPNNGGREPFQMYFIAFLQRVTGMAWSFNLLKLASGLEGVATLIVAYFLGVEMMGRDSAAHLRLGRRLGLMFALLLALSSWHWMLSRLGLRIVLTPLTTALTLIFLIRVLRYNRRSAYLWLGLTLGAGFYFYQANRMLPVLVGVGIALNLAMQARSWASVRQTLFNSACMGLLALVIFLPMYRYQQAFPQDFWNRTYGRLFGEEAFIRVNPETGLSETYTPSLTEQVARFFQNFDQFRRNYGRALGMWGWRGDGAWINNGEARPALDPFTNGLLILGVAAWLGLIMTRWQAAHVLVPLGVLIMLLPSALTLAYPVENPSFTRASGAIPFVFLLAAYPLAQMLVALESLARRAWLRVGLAGALCLPLMGGITLINSETYFNVYRDSYANSWKPYALIAAPLRDFARNGGSYGNAFMIAYPHWLDHRILGVAAGDIEWDNGLVQRQDLFSFIALNQGTPYQYDPTRPLFLMFNALDTETYDWLKRVFPNGQTFFEEIPERPDVNFFYYIVPPAINWLEAEARARAES